MRLNYDSGVRLVVYTDSVYHAMDGVTYGELAFTTFVGALAEQVDRLTVVGRLSPERRVAHHRLPSSVRFVGLPYYASLAEPGAALSSLWSAMRLFWHAIDDADRVWLLGPFVHGVAFALLGLLRRRGVVLGVRQDYRTYVRMRRPAQRWMHVVADALDLTWRALARLCPVIVVGPDLALQYRRAPKVLPITVSLISSADVAAGERAASRDYDGPLTVLSVGRLDLEKNPVLLADALDRLRRRDDRWQLVVCGEGPLKSALADRLAALGLTEHAKLRGYLPVHGGLLELYRLSHAFLHVSWTEGVPQVLIEAFASGLPVVATAVGGVPEAARDAALLVPPGDPDAAAQALAAIGTDAELRRRLVRAGFDRAREQTLERETARVVEFIRALGSAEAVA